MRRYWKVGPSDIEPDLLPDEGIALSPLKVSAADFVEQAVAFFSTRFTGNDLAEERIPFVRFKTIIDAAYDSFRKIFPPPIVENRSLGRSMEFGLLQPKFSSLIIAIDRPNVDERDVRKYVSKMPSDWEVFAHGFEKTDQSFLTGWANWLLKPKRAKLKKLTP
jgi:hypothetical protein